MTYRKTLIWGLTIALSLAPGLVRAADASAQQAASASSTWKSSDQSAIADIRFKKPDMVVFTDQGAEPDNRAVTTTTPAKVQTITSAKVKISAPAQAQATPAERPVAEAAVNHALAALPAEPPQQDARDTTRASTPLTDEQLQLVSRILLDGQVVRAAEEEPLPVVSDADRNTNGGGTSIHAPSGLGDDVCCDACCPPPPRLFWVAGVEATFLNPDLNSDGVTWAVEEVEEEREDWFSSHNEDVDSIYLSPRIWLGVQGCCWGANLRYWHLNASESFFDPSIGADGTWDDYDCGAPNIGVFSSTRLEAYTVDLEITRRFCLHDCWMQGSFGVRHAEIEHGESLTGTALTSDANLFGYAEAERYTRGTGIVLGWYGRKPLFPCSCVHWFYNLRWSALWGPTQTAVETGATVLATDANAGSINGASTSVDDNLFISEIQLGLEWNYALRCMPANAFFRAAVEYQRWAGGIGYSEASSFAGIEVDDEFTEIGTTFASAAAPELDLIGITLGTGLTW